MEARIIAFIGPNSSVGRKAGIAAGNQDKLFNYMQILFDNQGKENTGWLDDAMVQRAAEFPGSTWSVCSPTQLTGGRVPGATI